MCIFESRIRYELGLFEAYQQSYASEGEKLYRYAEWMMSQDHPDADDVRTFLAVASKVFDDEDMANQLSDIMPMISDIMGKLPPQERQELFPMIGDLAKDRKWVQNTARLGYRRGMPGAFTFSSARDMEDIMVAMMDTDKYFNIQDAQQIIENNQDIVEYVDQEILRQFLETAKEEAEKQASAPGFAETIKALLQRIVKDTPPDYFPDNLEPPSDR